MKIDVALNPAEIALLPERDLSDTICIVFDVLRATSSMTTALAHHAAEIHPVRTIEEALHLKRLMPHAVLGGERSGEPIPGFELGNSPLEYRENVCGKTIVTTTTNGTMALCACAHASRVLVGALLNIDALTAAVGSSVSSTLLLICAGTFETFALEDALAAGVLIAALERAGTSITLSDAARAVRFLPPASGDYSALLRTTQNGRVLVGKGRGAEVDWCARCSQYNVVGLMESAVVRPLPQ